jgi:hypothetical protein
MRIKTARTLKSIDSWKNRVNLAKHKYIGLLAFLLTAFGSAKAQSAIVSIFIIGVSVNFAVIQFGFLLLVGFLLLKLHFCKMANMFLRFV